MMDVDHGTTHLPKKIGRQNLHVASQDDQVDPDLVEQGPLARLLFGLVLLRDREHVKGNVELPGNRAEILVIAQNHGNLTGQLAGTVARLRNQLVEYLRSTADPRFTDAPVKFDDYPYRGSHLKQEGF